MAMGHAVFKLTYDKYCKTKLNETFLVDQIYDFKSSVDSNVYKYSYLICHILFPINVQTTASKKRVIQCFSFVRSSIRNKYLSCFFSGMADDSHLIFGVQPQLVVPYGVTDFTPVKELLPTSRLPNKFIFKHIQSNVKPFIILFTENTFDSHLILCVLPQLGSCTTLNDFTPAQHLLPAF